MVRITCLSPTKSYSYCSSAIAHLEILIFKLRTTILLLEAIIEQTYKTTKNTSKNNTPELKDRARCYGYESARNTENRTKTTIL